MNRNVLFLGLFMMAYEVLAQPSALYFEKLNTDNGLSHNKVNCILQDQRGFYWIGTEDGLNRYDGNDFLVFRAQPGRSDHLGGNIITALHEDNDGVLWIATADGGLSRYDYRLPPSVQFKQYKNKVDDPSSIPVNSILALCEDRQGFLWLATAGRLVLRFNKTTGTFEEPVTEGTRTALTLGLDHKDILWVGRQGGGILKLNTRTLQYETDPRYSNLYEKLPHAVVTSFFEDKDKEMWFGSWDKVLYRYTPSTDQETYYDLTSSPARFVNDEITDILQDDRSRLWLAGKNKGLQMYDKQAGMFYHYQSDPALAGTLAGDRINCLFLDKTGHIWAGTNQGICIARLEQQFVQQFLPGSFKSGNPPVTIYDFYKDSRNTLWIGTSNGIYIQYNGKKDIEHHPLYFKGEPIAVTKFFHDTNGEMYLGTNYSFFKYHQNDQSLSLLPNTDKDKVMNRLIESRVVSVVRDTIDDHPVFLVSPYGHYLTYYDLVRQQWVSRVDSVANIVTNFKLKDNLIRKFHRGVDGRLWMAMAGQGLGLWEQTPRPSVRYFANAPEDPQSISNNNVFDMVEDDAGHLWVTTYGGGLHYFNTKDYTFKHIPASGNLQEGIAIDGEGRLWMVSGGVLHQYNVADSSYISFDLPDLENTGGVRGHIYEDTGGFLYAAGPGYFFRFNPMEIHQLKSVVKTFFTDFKIFNQSYSHLLFDNTIRLRYNQNYFTIEFAAPHPPAAEKIKYRYMLEGVDEDWVESGTRNTASYPNTGNGHFVFKVQASTDNSWGDDTEAILTITVVPPVWKRWWFLSLLAALVLAVILGIQRYRLNELLKRQAIRNRIAQDLHDNIGSTLSSISVYSQVARIQNEKHQDETLDELLGKISVTSNDMISDMNDIVWAINPRNDSMEKIIQRMESYARPLLFTRNIQFQLVYGPEVVDINLDMEKRKNLYLIFKEAINNAFKYSGGSLVEVHISLQGSRVDMSIKDNGTGFLMAEPKISLSGNGLDNMRSRAKEMNADVQIVSHSGQGTEVRLMVNIP